MSRPVSITRARKSGQDSGRVIAFLCIVPLVVGLGVFAVYPFIYLIGLAITESNLANPFQEWIGGEQFAEALGDERFVASLWRSVALAFTTTGLAMFAGVGMALLLDQAVKARDLIRTLILLPLLTPPVTAAIMWQLLLIPNGGLVNAVLADLSLISAPVSFLGEPTPAFASLVLADVWQWAPFVALMSFAALQTLPTEVYEAAKLEVRSKWSIFRWITLPMLLPGLIGIAVLKLVIAFKLFDLVFVLTAGGPGQSTTVSSFYIYRIGIQQFNIGLAAAMTLLFAIVVGLATIPFTVAHDKAVERLS
ncbi:MAG: sugar ABC transporter permease [Rhodobacteraceae bacterium]|nr:sugar ABC transporter permease [Paracoccaceae bacterium]